MAIATQPARPLYVPVDRRYLSVVNVRKFVLVRNAELVQELVLSGVEVATGYSLHRVLQCSIGTELLGRWVQKWSIAFKVGSVFIGTQVQPKVQLPLVTIVHEMLHCCC